MEAPKASNISFMVLFNHVKGIHKPHKPEEVDENWLKDPANKKDKEKWDKFETNWAKQGI